MAKHNQAKRNAEAREIAERDQMDASYHEQEVYEAEQAVGAAQSAFDNDPTDENDRALFDAINWLEEVRSMQ